VTKNLAIGIDLGGTHIKYALVNARGEVWQESRRATQVSLGREQVLADLAECILELMKKPPDGYSVSCIGIGSPGLIDIERGYVMGGSPNLPEWEDLPLASILSDQAGLPVFVDNDANMMGLGEFSFGGNGGKNMLFLTIGTGIGGAIIIDGQLYRGHRYAGSELGCIPFYYQGQKGYWEDVASTAALVKKYVSLKGDSSRYDGRHIIQQYKNREKEAIQAVEEHIELVGEGIGGLINIFNPETVIVGGGISESGPFYIEGITRAAASCAMADCMEGVTISAARLGNKAGFMGAAGFALTRL